MWSNFHVLVDTAVVLSEQEETQNKQSSSSVTMMKRRYEVSTSSSSLLDFNKIPQNPNPKEDSSSLFPSNPQQRFDPFNAASTSSLSIMKLKDPPNPKEESSSLFPSNPKQHFDPFNVASTSSSLIIKPKDPQNPKEKSSSPSSCLTEETSRKRSAKKQRKSNCGFKKPKIDRLRFMERKVPDWVFNAMRNIHSEIENPRLIFETNLSASDVNPNQSRLLIPFNMLIINNFLTPAEIRAMNKEEYNQEDENVGVGTIVVNQRSEMLGLRFKIWSMEKKNSGKGTLNYALNWGWNDVVEDNNLKANDTIILWTFRCRDVLCFALDLSERV